MKCQAYVQGTKHTYNYNNDVKKMHSMLIVNSGAITSKGSH